MHKKIPKFFIFLDQYSKIISKNNNTNIGVIYRNYGKQNKEKELIKIAQACKLNRFKLFVSNDYKLALKLRADGVYIPAFNKTRKFLNIEKKQIDKYGAVSKQIAKSMLFNLHLKSKADLIIVTTGIAGPKGSTKNKPVGLVFIGIKFLKKNYIFKKNFKGTRIEIQKKTVQFIFNEIIKLIK